MHSSELLRVLSNRLEEVISAHEGFRKTRPSSARAPKCSACVVVVSGLATIPLLTRRRKTYIRAILGASLVTLSISSSNTSRTAR